MNVKLIMYWDIRPDKSQEDYFEFMIREWVPTTQGMGLQPVGAWYSVYVRDENEPRMMTEVLAEDTQTIKRVLKSEEWQDLHERLLEYVENYSHKAVAVTGDFQL